MTQQPVIDIPTFACQRWGQYEHDWLDCPDCLDKYEMEINRNAAEHCDQADTACIAVKKRELTDMEIFLEWTS